MRRTRLALAAAVVLLAACGDASGTHTPAAPVEAPALQAPITYAEPTQQVGCDGTLLPPAHAGLLALRPDGSQRFTVPLPPPAGPGQSQAPAVEDADGIYLGSGTSIVGLDPTDGHPRWERRGAGDLYGLWLDSGLLVALTDQVGEHAAVLGLDPADGSVRWRHDVPGNGLLGGQELTGDGGLAWVRADRQTEVLDLTTGQVRWTAPTTQEFPGLAALPGPGGLPGVVLRTTETAVVAYDSRTGDVRWSTPSNTAEVSLLNAGDVAILFQTAVGPALDGDLVALGADGRERWRVPGDPLMNVVALSPTRVVLATDSGVEPPQMTMLDTTTGQTRWTVDATAGTGSALSDTLLMTFGPVTDQAQTATARSAQDGRVRWTAPLEGYPDLTLLGDVVLGSRFLPGGAYAEVVTDAATGQVRSEFPLVGFPAPATVSPAGALVTSAGPSYEFCVQ